MASLEDVEVASHRARIVVVRPTLTTRTTRSQHVHNPSSSRLPPPPSSLSDVSSAKPTGGVGWEKEPRFRSKGNVRSGRETKEPHPAGEGDASTGEGRSRPNEGGRNGKEPPKGGRSAQRLGGRASSARVPFAPSCSDPPPSEMRMFDVSDEGGGGFGSHPDGAWVGSVAFEVNSIVNSKSLVSQRCDDEGDEDVEVAHVARRTWQASDRREGSGGRGRTMADVGSSDSASSFHSTEDPTRRIKNLDTGDEYFVGQAEATVKDAGTGVEVSMEDFQHAMGISPIEKEVARRERSMDTTTSTRHGRRTTHQDEQASTTGPREHAHNTSIRSSIKNAFRGLRRGRRANETKEEEEEDTNVPTKPVENETQSTPTSTRNATLPTDVRPNLKNKLYKDLLDVKLTQELVAHRSAVWTLKFSLDGKYLASAGQDTVVRVWEVKQCEKVADEERVETDTKPEAEGAVNRRRTSYEPGTACDPMFQPKPCRLFAGHKSDVLDLSWSDSQFLLSASMDKTVRLWHISMNECLRVFTHHDFVTSISFNPVDDKFFVSGSLDEKLRIWNIPDHNVADWVDVHEMVTAVSYSPDGKRVVVGTFKGKCKFYRAENNKLEYITQIEVRSKRGKNARGKKITGIQFLDGNSKRMLVSSNDSRIRLYDGYNLLCKYKGHKNKASQIHAFFSQNGDFIVSGSEEGSLYVWSTVHSLLPIMNPIFARLKKEKDAACEFFPAHVGTTTVALFAPESSTRSKKLLSRLSFASKIAGPNPDPEHTRLLQEVRTYSPELGAAKLAEASMTAVGQVIVTAGFGGEIKVFESFGLSLGP